MSEQILTILKRRLDDLSVQGEIDVETRHNTLKEELQFYVLNFIYHHPEYNEWVMYGGSALRICHDLNRMSVDLDFEIGNAVNNKFLNELKKEIEKYFINAYGAGSDFLTVKIITARGLLLKFNIGEELRIGHSSKQVHVKIDLNYFIAPEIITERIPVNHSQLSFVINTYGMSTLMASKIAAIFLRGTRGVGKEIYEEKGRDIYDLLWYMNKKVMPNLNYLNAKGINIKDLRALFDKLTLQMNKVSNLNLKHDLTPLFVNQAYIENWLQNWLETYFQLLDGYKINVVTTLEGIRIFRDFRSDNFYFIYLYKTEDENLVRIVYTISDYWIEFSDGDLPIQIDKKLSTTIEFTGNVQSSKPVSRDRLTQYATLFRDKNDAYLKETNRIILGDNINTRVIRMTADNLNQKEQIRLNKSALLSCKLDDLLK